MSDMEAPDADVQEQEQIVEKLPLTDSPSTDIEAPEADALEQIQPVPIDWDEQQEG